MIMCGFNTHVGLAFLRFQMMLFLLCMGTLLVGLAKLCIVNMALLVNCNYFRLLCKIDPRMTSEMTPEGGILLAWIPGRPGLHTVFTRNLNKRAK